VWRGSSKDYEEGTHDGSVGILVTGCEVSLRLGEQREIMLFIGKPIGRS